MSETELIFKYHTNNPTHKKIGKDALRELSDPKTIARIKQ